MVLAISAFLVFVVLSNSEMEAQSERILKYYSQDLLIAKQLQQMNTKFSEITVLMGTAIQSEDDLYVKDAEPLVQEIEEILVSLEQYPELNEAVVHSQTQLAEYLLHTKTTIKKLINGQMDYVENLLAMRDSLTAYRQSIVSLEERAQQLYSDHQQSYAEKQEAINEGRIQLALLVALFIVATSLLLISSVISALGLAQRVAVAIAQGQWDTEIPETHGRDESGKLLLAVAQMRDNLRKSQEKQMVSERILTVLNSLTSNSTFQPVAKEFRVQLNTLAFAIYRVDSSGGESLLAYDSIDNKEYTQSSLSDLGVVHSVAKKGEALILPPVEFGFTDRIAFGFTDVGIKALHVWPIQFQDKVVGVALFTVASDLDEHHQGILKSSLDQLGVRVAGLQVELEREALVDELDQRSKDLEIKSVEAEHASVVKSEFIASMSHELRTPMNSIMGFTEFLKKTTTEKLNPRETKALQAVDKSAHHLLDLINDILDLSKIEAGKMELQLKTVEVVGLLADCISLLQVKADEKQLPITLFTTQEQCFISLDSRRFKQVILNFLSNAIKFTEEGAIEIKLDAIDDEGLEFLEISIKDTGIGIAEKDHEKLFQKFTQIDGSLTRSAGGTGLGLVISQQFVHLHGGRIEVESEVGVGSTFRIIIPRKDSVELAAG